MAGVAAGSGSKLMTCENYPLIPVQGATDAKEPHDGPIMANPDHLFGAITESLEQLADRAIVVNALDGVGQQARYAQDHEIGQLLVRRYRDAICHHDLTDRRIAQALDGLTAQHAVRGADVNLACAVAFSNMGSTDDATSCGNHVIEDDCDFALQGATNQIGLLGLRGAGTALVYDGDGAAELLLMHQCFLDAAFVRAEDDQVALRNIQTTNEFVEDRAGVQMIDGDIEKALNLRGMQVESQHPIGAGGGQQVGDQLGRDRYAAHILTVLARVAVIG